MFIRGGYHAAKSPGARVALVEKAGLPKAELLVKLDGTLMAIGGILLALESSRSMPLCSLRHA
jgi:putative oxidoreductase